MALNTSKCNHLMPLRFKGLTLHTIIIPSFFGASTAGDAPICSQRMRWHDMIRHNCLLTQLTRCQQPISSKSRVVNNHNQAVYACLLSSHLCRNFTGCLLSMLSAGNVPSLLKLSQKTM